MANRPFFSSFHARAAFTLQPEGEEAGISMVVGDGEALPPSFLRCALV